MLASAAARLRRTLTVAQSLSHSRVGRSHSRTDRWQRRRSYGSTLIMSRHGRPPRERSTGDCLYSRRHGSPRRGRRRETLAAGPAAEAARAQSGIGRAQTASDCGALSPSGSERPLYLADAPPATTGDPPPAAARKPPLPAAGGAGFVFAPAPAGMTGNHVTSWGVARSACAQGAMGAPTAARERVSPGNRRQDNAPPIGAAAGGQSGRWRVFYVRFATYPQVNISRQRNYTETNGSSNRSSVEQTITTKDDPPPEETSSATSWSEHRRWRRRRWGRAAGETMEGESETACCNPCLAVCQHRKKVAASPAGWTRDGSGRQPPVALFRVTLSL